MSINIQYPKQFSKEYKDFIIVLSKLSELNNIKNLPFDTNSISQSKELEKNLKENLYYESFVKSNNSRSYHNIKLILIPKLKNDQYIFNQKVILNESIVKKYFLFNHNIFQKI